MLKYIPLSKEPSPNWSVETSVKEAKTPNFVPFAKDLDKSIVIPSSPARFSPYDIFASKGIRL